MSKLKPKLSLLESQPAQVKLAEFKTTFGLSDLELQTLHHFLTEEDDVKFESKPGWICLTPLLDHLQSEKTPGKPTQPLEV